MPMRFRPVDSTFYDLITESAVNLVEGAHLLAEMFSSNVTSRTSPSGCADAEHEADETTHLIMRRLNSTFVTPFDRDDIYRARVRPRRRHGLHGGGRRPDRPLQGRRPARRALADQVEVLQRAAELTAEAMPRLRSMDYLAEYWIEVNRLENQADKIHRSCWRSCSARVRPDRP